MDSRLKYVKPVRRKAVDIFDLPAIVDLYYAQNEGQEQQMAPSTERPLLTADFGIPLFVYTLERTVVAYTFVVLNAEMKNEYRIVVDEHAIGNIVAQEALSLTRGYYEENGMHHLQLKNAILHFVDWLNLGEKNRIRQ